MAAKDALSNAAQAQKISAADMKRREEEYERQRVRSTRETALEMALKMAPPEMVRSAEALVNDAAKLAAFILSGATPTQTKRRLAR